ncbi:MAG: PD40 domain-containing protein [Anaerolineales bacterium]|nr:PD40 domain-containing protein [Anaerolineales bacterium]
MPSIWPQRRNPLEDRILRRRRTPASALPGLGECNLLINDNDQSKLLTDDGGSGDILRLDGGAFAAIPPPLVAQAADQYILAEVSSPGQPGVNTGTRLDTYWRQDGLKVWSIFIDGSPSHAERQFDVSPAWGIQPGDWTLDFTSGAGSSNNRSIWWSPDGTKFSRCRRVPATQLNITVFDQSATPWDFTVLGAAVGKTWQPTGNITPGDHIWSADGLRLWVHDSGSGGRILEFTVGSAFDPSTITNAQIRSFVGVGTTSLAFSDDGKQLYFISSGNLLSRPLSTAFDIDTAGAFVTGPASSVRTNIPRGLTYRNSTGGIVCAGDQGSNRRLSFFRIP